MNGITKSLLIVFAGLLLIAAGAGLLAYRFLNTPASESEAVALFEVRPGESFKATAHRLESEGIVKSATQFVIYARLAGQTGKIRVGEYAIRRDSKPKDVLAIITSGRSVEYVVTISEGLNVFEVADIFEKQGVAKRDDFLALTRDKAFIRQLLGEDLPSLEGYLFPETYHITKFTGAKGLVKMMVDRFKENYEKLLSQQGWNAKGMKRHELVTLASIVEKETGAPEERPVISSVFHNRLRLNMRLQTDPTVVYGVWEQTGKWNKNISKDDLLRPTRYNTYTLSGLPYGPIANPGFEALKAAGAPAETEFLFFVSRNDGTHIFSKDYSGHQKAVTKFQLDRKAREGKSWRDLQKREKAPEKVNDASALKRR